MRRTLSLFLPSRTPPSLSTFLSFPLSCLSLLSPSSLTSFSLSLSIKTCFVCQQQQQKYEDGTCRLSETTSSEYYFNEEDALQEDIPELYLLSDEDFNSDGKSVDYGFIIAVTCLLTGISLVAISYTIPRDVKVDPDSVSAREMERLEREKARVGAHLDRCVIAGLCLLTLGGVLLSTLLMISMYKGEMMRRRAFAYSKHAAKLYGSIDSRVSLATDAQRGFQTPETSLQENGSG
uniref:Transmembrane protein 74 n=1 Tax=Periophthalmus magnuspinnatus TaxID=409849 RepID=A0A3B3Z935_9GOBI